MVLGDNWVQKTSSGLLLGTCSVTCHVHLAVPLLQAGKRGPRVLLLPLQLCWGPGSTALLLALPYFCLAGQWLC